MEQLLPTLDVAKLQQAVNEAAMKGALKSIEEFYTGYDSPFRKKVTEALKQTDVHGALQLPDVIALINKSLSAEIDRIANAAMAQSFIPMVQQFLTRAEDEVNFSDILKWFISEYRVKSLSDVTLEMKRDNKFGWYSVTISFEDGERDSKEYSFTLHQNHDDDKTAAGKATYQLLSLPNEAGMSHYGYQTNSKTMKMVIGESFSLELPFIPEVLKDRFISKMAGYVIAGSKFIIDVTDFEEEMIERDCHCD